MREWLQSFGQLFFPDVCPACGEAKRVGSGALCMACLYGFPLTGFGSRPDNPVLELFAGQLPVVQASSFFWYIHDSPYRKMIHMLKYYGSWQLARQLGEWMGAELEQGGLYGDVDVVAAVPLHPFRRMKRGYNQSEYIAKGIASKLERPTDFASIVRRKYNKSQATRPREERWENVEGIFAVRRPKRLAGKHILLVDDVLTTGATIVSCAEAILEAVPDCRISIATLSVSKSHLQPQRRRARTLDDFAFMRKPQPGTPGAIKTTENPPEI
ncbi:MAG: ComF family protein [Rikenellaceae bacterium]|jgi:ComF family protein|nr:ComF family protein [Rikenellaceae bacterium]